MELLDEGSDQVWLLSDEDIFHVALHCCQCPVEGAGDEQLAVHHCKLVMHVHGANVAPYTDSWRAGRRVHTRHSTSCHQYCTIPLNITHKIAIAVIQDQAGFLTCLSVCQSGLSHCLVMFVMLLLSLLHGIVGFLC